MKQPQFRGMRHRSIGGCISTFAPYHFDLFPFRICQTLGRETVLSFTMGECHSGQHHGVDVRYALFLNPILGVLGQGITVDGDIEFTYLGWVR
jgi:hypothetical protein